MDRITDHLFRLAQRVAEGRWVTIGAKAGKKTNGKKKGGVPVLLDDDGKIVKGPAKLTGKKPNELKKAAPAAKGQSGPAPKAEDKPKAEPKKPASKPKQKKDWEDKQEEKHQKALADVKAADAEKAAVAAKARELLGKVTDPGQKAELQKLIDRAEGRQEQPAAPTTAKAEDLGASKHGLVGKLLGSPDGPGDSYSDFRIPGSNMASLAREIGEDKVKAIANYFRDQYQNGPQAKEWKQIEDGTHPRVSKEDYPTREDFDDADLEYHNAYIDKKADRHKREDLEKTPSVAAAQHWLSQYLENNPDASGLKSANDALQEIISGRQREDGPVAPPKLDQPKKQPKPLEQMSDNELHKAQLKAEDDSRKFYDGLFKAINEKTIKASGDEQVGDIIKNNPDHPIIKKFLSDQERLNAIRAMRTERYNAKMRKKAGL